MIIVTRTTDSIVLRSSAVHQCYTRAVNPNIFLFTGENSYALRKEIGRWRDAFQEKYGIETIERLDGARTSPTELLDVVATLPFLAEKRMVIVDQIPKATKEQIQLLAAEIHPNCVLLIIDEKPDKRTVAYKAIKDIVTIKTFDALPPAKLLGWIVQECEKSAIQCPSTSAQFLIDMVGEDQELLSNEIQKLIAYMAPQNTLTPAIIDLLCVPSGEQVIWKLTDLLGKKDIAGALRFLAYRYERGEDPYGVWVVLLNAVKNIATIWMALQEAQGKESDVSAKTGMHFLSVRGLLPLCRSLTQEQVRTLVTFAACTDIALKSGKLKYTVEQPQEVMIAAERLILCCL